jgi:hypothetical protein
MSEPSLFELESAIRRWRAELQQLPALSGANVDELEGHLRDAIAALQNQSLNEEEAFWLARRRLGTPEQLEREFRPINRGHIWQQRTLWMVAGYLIISAVTSLIISVVRLILVVGLQAGIPAAFGSWLNPVLQIAGLGGLVYFVHQILRRFNQSAAMTSVHWMSPWKHGLILFGIIVGANVLGAVSIFVLFRVTEPRVFIALSSWPTLLISALFWPVLFIWMLHRARATSVVTTSG